MSQLLKRVSPQQAGKPLEIPAVVGVYLPAVFHGRGRDDGIGDRPRGDSRRGNEDSFEDFQIARARAERDDLVVAEPLRHYTGRCSRRPGFGKYSGVCHLPDEPVGYLPGNSDGFRAVDQFFSPRLRCPVKLVSLVVGIDEQVKIRHDHGASFPRNSSSYRSWMMSLRLFGSTPGAKPPRFGTTRNLVFATA